MLVKNKLSALLYLIFVIFVNDVFAASSCYDEEKYPNIIQIIEGENGLEFVAAGINNNKNSKNLPIIKLTNDTSWDTRTWKLNKKGICKTYKCLNKPKCNINIPSIKLSIDEALNFRSFRYVPGSIDQTISACTQNGDDIYFGISFYAGEGTSGVGGIGLYNIKTKDVEIRRLPIISGSSVTNIAFDGKVLWISTAHHYECSGTPPADGLILYNWDKKIIQDFEDINNGLCGFVIHDIHITNESIWIASDLGLSQTYRTKQSDGFDWEGGWRHYIPQVDKKEVMKKVWCKDLYSDLLNSLPNNDNPTGPSSYDQLFENMAEFKSYELMKYVDSITKDK